MFFYVIKGDRKKNSIKNRNIHRYAQLGLPSIIPTVSLKSTQRLSRQNADKHCDIHMHVFAYQY